MPTKVKGTASERVLMRILDAFARELIDASDEEILEAAKDLGMDPGMKGSAAFLGVIHATPRRLSDFFDVDELKKLLPMTGHRRLVSERRLKALLKEPVKPPEKDPAKAPAKTKSRSRRSPRSRPSGERKPSNGK